MLVKKLNKFMKNPRGGLSKENSSKAKTMDKVSYDGCYKCKKLEHMVKTTQYGKLSGRRNDLER